MKRVEEMTDAELDALIGEAKQPAQASGVENMSDEELDSIIASEQSQERQNLFYSPPEKDPAKLLANKAVSLGTGPAMAGAAAVADYLLQGGSFSESKAIFDDAQEIHSAAIKEAEARRPDMAAAANVADIATRMIPQGAPGALLGIGLGATDAISEHGLDASEIAKGVGFGTAGALAGEGIKLAGKGIGIAGRSIKSGAERAVSYISRWGEDVSIAKVAEKLGIQTGGAQTNFYNTIIHKGLDPEAWIRKVSEYELNGVPIFQGGYKEIGKKASEKIGLLSDELGSLLNQFSASNPNPIAPSVFASKMQKSLENLVKTHSEDALIVADKIKAELLDYQNMGAMSIKDVYNFKKTIGNSIDWGQNSGHLNGALEQIYTDANKFLASKIDDLPLDDGIKKVFSTANDELSNLLTVKSLTAKEPGKVFAKNAQMSKIGEMLKMAVSGPSSEVARHLSTEYIEPMAKSALLKVAVAATDGAEIAAPYVAKLVQAYTRAPDAVADLLAQAESAIDLYLSPIPRSTDALLQKDTQIYNVIKEVDPMLAKKLNTALKDEQYDIAGELMSSLSQMPKFRKFIEPGLGWDGKVTNETEKAVVRKQILDGNLSVMQQMSQIEALDKTGAIPAPQPSMEMRQLAKKPLRTKDGKKISEY